MNKICVYAIAKNEEKFAEQWYNSVSKADLVIVLDTGSTDNTVQMLRSLGAEVHEKQYEHFRFDIARNDCLDLVPEEYNIRVSIDLDEMFEKDDWADILRDKWDEENPRVIYSYVWAHNEGGAPGLQFVLNKIHGIDPNLRWEGAVHEHLMNMITHERTFDKFIDLRDEITVHHYADQEKDRMFYKDLILERIKDNPNDYQSLILAGNEFRVKGNSEDAIPYYKEVLNNFKDKCSENELAGVYYALGQSYMNTNQAVEAFKAYSMGIAVNKFYRDNYYGLGILLINNRMYKMAIGVLEEGLKTSLRQYFWMEDNYTWSFGLLDALACAYNGDGQTDKALSYAARALKYEPTNEGLLRNYNTYLQALEN